MAVILSVIGKFDGKDLARAQKQLAVMQKEAGTMANKFNAMGSKMQSVGKNIGKVGGSLTKGVTLPIIAGGAALLAFAKGAEDAEIANRKLGSVLESMGYPQATKRVSEFAETLERSLAVDADIIKATQTKLATFKNLTATVDQAGGAFDRATMAALDLAAAGFGSAEQNAVQLGKALQDPVKGITALGRAGVTFTEQEKEKIKALVQSGNLLGAQNMVLQALEQQVGGTAEAGASSFEKIKLSLMQVADAIGMAVLPLINQLSDFISKTLVPTVVPMIDRLVASFTNLDPAVKKAMLIFAGLAAAAGPLLIVIGKVVSIGGVLTTALGAITIAGSLLFIKVIAVVAVLAAIGLAFKFAFDNSEPLRKAVDNLVNTFKNVFIMVKNSVLGAFTSLNNTTVKSTSFFTILGNYISGFFTGYVTMLTTVVKLLGGAFQVAVKVFEVGFTILRMVADVIRGSLLLAFDVLMNKLGPVSTKLRAVANGVRSAFVAIAGFVRAAFNNVGGIVEGFINKAIGAVNILIGAFNFLSKFLPGVSAATEIAEFRFNNLSAAAEGVGNGASLAASAMDSFTSEAGRANMAANNAATVNKVAAKTFDGVGTAATGAGGAAKKAGDKAKEAADKFKTNFTAVHEHLTGIVDDIRTKMAEMATSVSDSLMRGFNLGDTVEEFGEGGERIGGTFIERLQAQADKVVGFAARIKELMALGLGLDSPLMQAVIAEGAGSGTAIAQSLIDSGAEGINNATGILEAAQGAADEIGTLAASNFFQAGLDSAQQTVNAFVARFGVDGKGRNRLMSLMDNLAKSMSRRATITVDTINRVFTERVGNSGRVAAGATGGIVKRPTFALIGESGPEAVVPLSRTRGNEPLPMMGRAGGMGTVINLTVNAGMGADGVQVGEQIVSALRQYQRRNGALPIKVA